jgi:hypothetical protein
MIVKTVTGILAITRGLEGDAMGVVITIINERL